MDNPNLSTSYDGSLDVACTACDTIVPASSSVVVTAAACLARILVLARVLVLVLARVDVDVDVGNDVAVSPRMFPPLAPLLSRV